MRQKSIPSFVSYLQDSKKYIWIFLFSQLFPACFYIANNAKDLYSVSVSREVLSLAIFVLAYLFIFIFIGYLSKWFFRKTYKRILIILIILNFIGNGLEFFLYLNFGTQMTQEMIPILLETDKNEAAGFLNIYLNNKLFFVLTYYLLGIIISINAKKYMLIAVLALSMITIFSAVNFFNLPAASYLKKGHIYFRVWQSYKKYKDNARETKRLMTNYDERFKDVKVTDSIPEGTYVLIIGESFSRNHSSLYGYPRETSPNMVKRYKDGDLYKFNDVVSPHHYTRDAVLKILSEYSYDSDKQLVEYLNIIDIFKKAVYKTFWLSNQQNISNEAAGLNSIINRANKIEFTEKQNDQNKERLGLTDKSLFPFIEDALADNSKKKFIIIHLFGSHYNYEKRYQQEFAFFDEDSLEPYFSDLQKKHKKTINAYHNSLRFNDYIFDEIVKKVDDSSQNSFIIYLSDHGQLIYDDNIDHVGHTDPHLSMKGVEIPMVLWTSDYYRENNKEKIERIKAAENLPFDSEDVIYPIIDLANLKYEGYKPEKDLFNENFKERPRQVSNDGLFYEKEPQKDYVDVEDVGTNNRRNGIIGKE